ncbi:hypothetical protein SMD11_6898 [Streptomyces albireticuli]|uniref:Uncharacterized protein n=1 Tax=Streptomyces albireticuli TaxID=1940 RepID=A0A1Z2LDU3_9ACTN|nr:hypothetical protein SMD11_6898 [Streptomyces albireticuli]
MSVGTEPFGLDRCRAFGGVQSPLPLRDHEEVRRGSGQAEPSRRPATEHGAPRVGSGGHELFHELGLTVHEDFPPSDRPVLRLIVVQEVIGQVRMAGLWLPGRHHQMHDPTAAGGVSALAPVPVLRNLLVTLPPLPRVGREQPLPHRTAQAEIQLVSKPAGDPSYRRRVSGGVF